MGFYEISGTILSVIAYTTGASVRSYVCPYEIKREQTAGPRSANSGKHTQVDKRSWPANFHSNGLRP